MKDELVLQDGYLDSLDDEVVIDELEVDDFLARRTPEELTKLIGDLEVTTDIDSGLDSVTGGGESFGEGEAQERKVFSDPLDQIELEAPSVSDVDGLVTDVVEPLDGKPDDEMVFKADRRATIRAIEAIIMVSEQPVSAEMLAEVLETTPALIEELCDELHSEYVGDQRGFVLSRVAGGYRFASHPELLSAVEQFVLGGQSARLSGAALETLAIVAYKQPVSRAQIASIRGVNVDGVLKTLESKGWVAEIAKDSGPGQALLYGTTPLFLEKLGIDSIADLPPIGEFMPQADIVDALERTLAGGERDPRALRAPSMTSDDIDEVLENESNN